jgi:hypothetical protein
VICGDIKDGKEGLRMAKEIGGWQRRSKDGKGGLRMAKEI